MVGLAADAVEPADHERDPRHPAVARGAHQPRAGPLDAGPLRLEAHHQAGLVGEVDEREVERVAQLQQPQRLLPGGDVGGAAVVHRVVGHDPDRDSRRRGPGR